MSPVIAFCLLMLLITSLTISSTSSPSHHAFDADTISDMRNSSIFSHINGIQLGDVYSTQSDGHLHPHPQLTSTPPFALTGACDTLPNTDEERFRNPCAKVVTYPFYIPIGSSKVAMELRARNSLNNSVLQAAGQTCASRMVRLTCGNIYRRCTNNVDFEDYATYNYQIYTDDVSISTVGLPFDRPCVSVCTEARLACGGTLYSFAAVLPNCTERLDYSRGSAPGGAALVRRYDPTNTQCYVPAIVTINAQVENFIPKNNMSSFCSGYASSMLIGAGPAVNDSYTVLQEPNTIQNAIVQRLQGLRNNLPPFLSSDCMAAAKKYFCYQTLLTPQRVTIRRALEYSNLPNVIAQLTSANSPLLTSFIYMPMLPPQNICLDYEDKCASFIESANSTNITPNCTGFVRNRPGVTAFPTMNQTFTTVTTTTGLLLKFPSYVNNDLYYNTSEMAEYTPTCPRGYVMPDDPDHEDVRWIGFSVCAVACKINIWTENEWKSLINFAHLVPVIGIAFSVFTLIFLCWNMQDIDKNYPFFVFTLLSFFLCVFGIPIIFVGIIGNYESFGFARSQPWCYVLPPSADPLYLDYKLTGLPIFICTLICIGVLIMHSIAFNTCHVKSRPYFVSRVHIEHPTEDDGEGGILCVAETQKCSKDRKIAALELPTYPEQITNFEEDQVVDVGSPREEDDEHMRRANPRTLSSQSNNSHTPIPYDNLHIRPLPPLISTHNPPNMLRYKLFVLVVCIIIFIPYFASKLSAMRTVGENRDAYAEFTQCVFQNYRGDDEDWETACGDHPSIRPSSSGVLFLCVALCGSMIIVGPLMLFCLGLDLCLKSGEKSKSIFEDN